MNSVHTTHYLSQITALVTGGTSGLGAATARHIVANGGRVLVADLPIQIECFQRMQLELDHGGRLNFCEVDVTNERQIEEALNEASNMYGEEVNACVNCAGIATSRRILSKPNTKDEVRLHSLKEFQKTIEVNTVGSFNVARLSAERIASRNPNEDGMRGSIIFTASIAAFDGQIGQVAYSASKGAIIGMTLPLARDLAPLGIRVVSIAPGLFETPLLAGLPDTVRNELGASVPCPSRLGKPNEFGSLVGHILTNSMINGEYIRLDGALRMPPK